ncbi:MAG: methylenetetrahydrofolate--tRNA-(uracil(54)-C(5))-methyltransferase (FADH(2)-oxidizing) TrmFO [Chitinophagales bacterium]
MSKSEISIIGGGLAGCEAAYKLAQAGIGCRLYEMRPERTTPAHRTGYLAELVCSNSLKSDDPFSAQGLLKAEMRLLGSIILEVAEECKVKAGSSLAVDRKKLGAIVTSKIESHPLIEVVRTEVTCIQETPAIIASGPLTSDKLAENIKTFTGQDNLYFFDAIAPVISAESINFSKVYRASRYGKGEADYLNCPMNQDEYHSFINRLLEADSIPINRIDEGLYFSGCMPIETMARKGQDTLRFGPMRPVGLPDPESGNVPYAVVQLRAENQEQSMYSLVGFQTRMRWGMQEQVLRLIPGLESADFLSLGAMHRNTYINSPLLLNSTLDFKNKPGLFMAGQLTGVEGYMESSATGIIAGINAVRYLNGLELVKPPQETMIGSLCSYVSDSNKKGFQPMNANFGLLPGLGSSERNKRKRISALIERALSAMREFSESSLTVL